MSFILQATKKADQQSAELLAIDQPDNAMSGSSSRPAINWMAGLSAVISLSAIAFFAVHQTDNTDRAIAEQNKIAASLSSSSNVVEQNSALTEPVTTKLPSQESTFSDLEVVTSVKPKLLNSPESTAAVEKFSTRQVVAIDKDEVQAEGIVREEVGLEAVGLDEVKGKEIADNVATKQKTIEVRSIAEITVDADDEEATNLRLKEERPADELLVQELLTKRTVKSKTEDESSEDDTNDGVVGDLQDTDAVAIAAGSSELSSELDETIIRTVSPTLVDITSSQTPNTSATDFQSVESNSVLSTLQTDTVAMIDGEDGDQSQPPPS